MLSDSRSIDYAASLKMQDSGCCREIGGWCWTAPNSTNRVDPGTCRRRLTVRRWRGCPALTLLSKYLISYPQYVFHSTRGCTGTPTALSRVNSGIGAMGCQCLTRTPVLPPDNDLRIASVLRLLFLRRAFLGCRFRC